MPTYRGATEALTIPEDLATALLKLSTSNGVTLFSTLLAGWAHLLQRLTGAPDLIIGIPSAGQQFYENQCLVGHCVNLLPVRFLNQPDVTFEQHLRVTQDLVLAANEHQDCTFSSLLPDLNVFRARGKTPLISTTFNIESHPEELDFFGLTYELSTNPRSYFQFELGLNIVRQGSELVIEASYNSDIFDGSSVRRWLK